MNVTVAVPQWQHLAAEALVLGVPQAGIPEAGLLHDVDAALGGLINRLIKAGAFKGKAEEVEVLYPVTGLGQVLRISLFGMGEEALSLESLRDLTSAGIQALLGKCAHVAILLPGELSPELEAEAAAEATILSAYQFKPYKTEPDPAEILLTELTILSSAPKEAEAGVARGKAMAEAVSWVRDLANEPGNKLTIDHLVAEARSLQKQGLAVTVKQGDMLSQEGFGCLVGVGQGSVLSPAFVIVEYRGAPEGEQPIVLVGKGITFDTGGICIKPRAGMEEMKSDMHGAATVMATLRMAAERKLKLNLVGLLCIAENMPSGNAINPGDILTAYNGMTVEVIDTDAEGRLVLSDGLSYGVKNYEPAAIISIATLTGSVIMALGHEATGLFTNRSALAASLKTAGEATGERVWRLPSWDVYARMVKSDIADVANLAHEKGDAITAAMFLKSFVGETPWVHLDIAGSSWIPEARSYRPKGATGVGVRLLINWLETGGHAAS